jgi:hypothetical protein
MGLVNLPFVLVNGEIADADEVMADFNALRDGVNNIETENIVNKNVTEEKLADSVNPVIRTDEIGARNFIVDGNNWITTTVSPDLNYTFNAVTVYVEGNRIEVASFTRAYTALRDTYLDIDTTGTITFGEVLNGAVAPAQAPNTLRLAYVETDATEVTDVVLLGAVTAFPTEAQIKYKYIEANITRNTTAPSTPGNQLIFVQFKGFDNTGVLELETGEAGVTIDLGNKGVPNGFDIVANPTLEDPLHIYIIAAADGSQPIAGLASEESTFADVGPFAGTFPPGYDRHKYVGSVYTDKDGYTVPSIQNGDAMMFLGGFIKDVFSQSENGRWTFKNLSNVMPLNHSREILFASWPQGRDDFTQIGHQGITPNSTNVAEAGTFQLGRGDQADTVVGPFQTRDQQTRWVPISRDGIFVVWHDDVLDGTGNGGQSADRAPNGAAIVGWRYFHD